MEAAEVLRVLDALDAAGVRAGITGGWGIDALLRRETRPHGDVDLGVASEALDVAIDALRPLCYAVAADDRPARVVLTSDSGHVDLHPIVWDAAGAGVQTGLDGERFDYPAGSLEAEGQIAGRIVRCGTPELQVAFHSRYEPREHDRRDMAALAAAFDLAAARVRRLRVRLDAWSLGGATVASAARRMMGTMSETRERRRTVGIAIAAVLVLFVLISPIVLTGSSPSLLSLLLLAGMVLGAGLLMRWRGGAESRTLGTILAVVGGLSLVLVVAVLIVVLNSWGP